MLEATREGISRYADKYKQPSISTKEPGQVWEGWEYIPISTWA